MRYRVQSLDTYIITSGEKINGYYIVNILCVLQGLGIKMTPFCDDLFFTAVIVGIVKTNS